MAEGVFTIEANIVPVVDEAQLERQTANIVKQFNSLLAKNIKPVQIAPDAKSFSASQTFASKIINQLNIMNSETSALNKTLSTTANTFDLIAKGAVDLAKKGLAPIAAEIQKIAPAATAAFRTIRAVGGTAFDLAKQGALQFTNFLNVTNTNILGFAGNIRKAIQENVRFKQALDGIVRTGGAIRDLPAQFKNLQASVIAGVSPLQRAADAGNGLSRSLVPFLIIGVTVAREISQISEGLRRLGHDIQDIATSFVSLQQREESALNALGKNAPAAKAAINDLTIAVPKLRDKLSEIVIASRGEGPAALTQKLKDLRAEFIQTELRGTGFAAVIKRLFAGDSIDNIRKAKAELVEINRTIVAVGQTKADIPFLSRLKLAAQEAADKIRSLGTSIAPSVRNLVITAALDTSRITTQVKASAKKLGDDFKDGFNAAAGNAGGGIKGKLAGLFGGLSNAFKDESGRLGLSFSGGIVDALKKVGGAAKSALTGGLGGLSGVLGQVSGQLGLGSIAGLGFAGALVGLGTAALNAAAKFQTIEVALNGITGGKGKQALQDLAAFAAVTPFRLETAANAAIKLQSSFAGLDTRGAIAIETVFTGAAAAVGATDDAINRVLLGFTQIQSAGKLTADNVRQVTEALPNISQAGIIAALAKEMGVTKDEARKLYREGLVPAADGLKAIATAAAEVPGATDALQKQAGTFAGLLSTLKDNATQLLAAIGGPLLFLAVGVLAGLNSILQVLILTVTHLGDAWRAVTGFLSGLVAQSRTYHGLLSQVVDKTKDAFNVFNNLSIAGFRIGDTFARMADGAHKVLVSLNLASDGAKNTGTSVLDMGQALKDATRALDPLARATDAFFKALASGSVKDISKSLVDFEEAQKDAANALQDSEVEVLKKTVALKSAFENQARAATAVTEAHTRITEAIKEHDKEIATKTIDLTEKLNAARDNTTESNNKVAESQEKLNLLLKGASAEDLEKADNSLAQAKLRLRQIIEDEKKAQDELNNSQNTALDLTGLSVDQIKSRLSVARAALAAQKALQKSASEAPKSAEQKSIDEESHAIDKRNAELAVTDALAAQNELKAKGTEKDPEIIAARQAVAAAEKESAKALEAQNKAQADLNALKEPDIAFTKTLTGLQKDLTAAQVASRDAARDTALAVAEAKGDKTEIIRLLGQEIKDTPGLTKVLEDTTVPEKTRLKLADDLGIKFNEHKKTLEDTIPVQQRLNDAINAALASGVLTQQQANVAKLTQAFKDLKFGQLPTGRKDIDDFIATVLSRTANGKSIQGLIDNVIKNVINKNFGGKDTNLGPEALKLFNNEAIKAVTLALAEGDKSQEEINDAIRNALLRIPGVGPLKFAQGAVVDKATPGIFGEAGREVILPLTRPGRLMDLLSHPQVLPPILSALERLALPTFASSMPTLESGAANPAALAGVSMVRSVPQIPPHIEQAKRDAALAKAIVSEMKESGVSLGQTIVNNDFTAPDPNDPLAKIHASQIAREVKRQIEKLL